MADIKISELGAASAVNSTDIFPITSAGVTVKATAQQIKNYMGVGNISDLNTIDKSSTVNAINEVNTKVSKTEDLISIVENGNTCTHTGGISAGQYVCWKGVLYTADSNISVGATFASSGGGKNLTAVDDGGLNKISDDLMTKFSFPANIAFDCTSRADFETKIASYVNNLGNSTMSFINVGFPAEFSPFNGTRGFGIIAKNNSNRWSAFFMTYGSTSCLNVTYNVGTFAYQTIS